MTEQVTEADLPVPDEASVPGVPLDQVDQDPPAVARSPAGPATRR